MSRPAISCVAPLFIVKSVPAALAFYRDRLGFDVTFEGPEPDDIFFGIVERGGAMVMFKTSASIRCRTAPATSGRDWPAGTHLHVPDPDTLAAEFASRGVEYFDPLGDTADGLRGFALRDVDGYVLFFGRTR